MQLGMVGLGRMGGNMSRRLARAGHEIVGFDLDAARVAEFEAEGMKGATDLARFAEQLARPRVAWLMVPAGEATETMVNRLAAMFEPGDPQARVLSSPAPVTVRRAAPHMRAICIADPMEPAITSRWCTTASSTG